MYHWIEHSSKMNYDIFRVEADSMILNEINRHYLQSI